MAYFLHMFTPVTWNAFRESGATVAGFHERLRRSAEGIKPGDLFLCYLTRLSRWCGVLEAETTVYVDENPLPGLSKAEAPHWAANHSVLPIRLRVKPVVTLEPESAVPIRDPKVWSALTITNQYDPGHHYWTGFFRRTLNSIKEDDGNFLVDLLKQQQENHVPYPLTDRDRQQLTQSRVVRTLDREVEVEIPGQEDEELSPESEEANPDAALAGRESIRYQAKIAQIGAEMGFHVWVPRNDKARVLEHVPPAMHEKFIDSLPLNYDDPTLRTVEQIDVLWLKGRSMARAFEIEHATAIYSGLLRMADLLALQPNIYIQLHIVAPQDRREKVLQQIKRPVFSLLERRPLYEQCSFLPYDAIDSLAQEPHLAHMNDSIIDEYAESAEV